MQTLKQRQQSMDALGIANEARSRTAQLKRDLKGFKVDPRELIRGAADNPALKTTTAYDFLTWIPLIGQSKASRILRRIYLSQTLCLGSLSEQTLDRLVWSLTETLNSRYRTKPFAIKNPDVRLTTENPDVRLTAAA